MGPAVIKWIFFFSSGQMKSREREKKYILEKIERWKL